MKTQILNQGDARLYQVCWPSEKECYICGGNGDGRPKEIRQLIHEYESHNESLRRSPLNKHEFISSTTITQSEAGSYWPPRSCRKTTLTRTERQQEKSLINANTGLEYTRDELYALAKFSSTLTESRKLWRSLIKTNARRMNEILRKPPLQKEKEDNLVIVNWEILPPGEWARNQAAAFFKSLPKEQQTSNTVVLLKERFDFYESLKPLAVTEINTAAKFSGYFGASFSPNVVMLEKLLYGNAIYFMPSSRWLELSQLTKFEVSKSFEVKRIVHRGNWRLRVRDYLARSTAPTPSPCDAMQPISARGKL